MQNPISFVILRNKFNSLFFMKNYLLLLAVATPLVFSSCGKDDEEAATPQENSAAATLNGITAGSSDPAAMQLTSEILSGNKWKLTGLHQTAENTIIYKDLYTKLPSCQKDDLYEFGANSNFTVTDGINMCGSSAQTKTGNWSLTNSANVTISANDLPTGLAGSLNIVQLSDSEMILRQTMNGLMYVVVFEKHVPSRAELIVNKNWRVTAEVEQFNGTSQDIFATAPACEKDNFIRFGGNSQMVMDEGATKCDPSDPQSTTLNYYFNGSSNIMITTQGFQQQYYIQALDATTLILQSYYYNGSGYTYTTTTYAAF